MNYVISLSIPMDRLSAANLFRMQTGGPHLPLYFTEAAGLLTIISLGHWLEASMTARAASLNSRMTLQGP